jgi:hypothetical protein
MVVVRAGFPDRSPIKSSRRYKEVMGDWGHYSHTKTPDKIIRGFVKIYPHAINWYFIIPTAGLLPIR